MMTMLNPFPRKLAGYFEPACQWRSYEIFPGGANPEGLPLPFPYLSFPFLLDPPLPSLSLPLPSTLPSPFPPLRSRTPEIQLEGLGERFATALCSSPSGVWGEAPAEIEFGAL